MIILVPKTKSGKASKVIGLCWFNTRRVKKDGNIKFYNGIMLMLTRKDEHNYIMLWYHHCVKENKVIGSIVIMIIKTS